MFSSCVIKKVFNYLHNKKRKLDKYYEIIRIKSFPLIMVDFAHYIYIYLCVLTKIELLAVEFYQTKNIKLFIS